MPRAGCVRCGQVRGGPDYTQFQMRAAVTEHGAPNYSADGAVPGQIKQFKVCKYLEAKWERGPRASEAVYGTFVWSAERQGDCSRFFVGRARRETKYF